MKKEDYEIKLPKDLDERLHLTDRDAYLRATANGFNISAIRNRQTLKERSINFLPIIFAIIEAVIAGVFWFIQKIKQIYLVDGKESLMTDLMLLGTIGGGIIFIIRSIKENKDKRRLFWRNLPTISAAFVILLFAGIYLFSRFLDIMFKHASFDYWTSMWLFLILALAINWIMDYLAKSLNGEMLINVLSIIIVGGSFFAIVSNENRGWWRHNISFLGTKNAASSWQFNITLIFSGILMIVLIDYLFVKLRQRYPENKVKNAIFEVMLILMSLSLAGVGVFPNDEGIKDMHHHTATLLIIMIILLIVCVRWLLPEKNHGFLMMSYFMGFWIAVFAVLFQIVHYFSLTAFELSAFVLAFGWLILLFKEIDRQSELGRNIFYVKIIDDKEGEKNGVND